MSAAGRAHAAAAPSHAARWVRACAAQPAGCFAAYAFNSSHLPYCRLACAEQRPVSQLPAPRPATRQKTVPSLNANECLDPEHESKSFTWAGGWRGLAYVICDL